MYIVIKSRIGSRSRAVVDAAAVAAARAGTGVIGMTMKEKAPLVSRSWSRSNAAAVCLKNYINDIHKSN